MILHNEAFENNVLASFQNLPLFLHNEYIHNSRGKSQNPQKEMDFTSGKEGAEYFVPKLSGRPSYIFESLMIV